MMEYIILKTFMSVQNFPFLVTSQFILQL